MNRRMTGGAVYSLLIVLILICTIPVVTQQSIPVVIEGYVFDVNGVLCNISSVRITNLNTSNNWYAISYPTESYYLLVLSNDDVCTADALLINTTDGLSLNRTNRTITSQDIYTGGLCVNITLEDTGVPDLSVLDIDAPTVGYPDVEVHINATIKNSGTGASAFNVSFSVDDKQMEETRILSLNTGENKTISFLWTPVTLKNCSLTVRVDTNNEIKEFDETTNNKTANITIIETPCADLIVAAITPATLYVNRLNTINVTVMNAGGRNINSAFNLSLKVNNETWIGNSTINALLAGESRTEAFSGVPPEIGSYIITAIADPEAAINESNDANNQLVIEMAVLMQVTVIIKDANEDIHILDLPLKGNESITDVTATACKKLNCVFDVGGANVIIDGLTNPELFLYDNTNEEWREISITHNLVDMDIIGWSGKDDLPPMLPDIAPEKIRIASFDGIVYLNMKNELEVNIKNNGLVNVSALNCVLNANGKFVSKQEIESLHRQDEKTILFYWVPKLPGNYTLSIVADPEDKIEEVNATNNNISVNVTVDEPIRVLPDYQKIQETIDAAPPGCMIIIEDGDCRIDNINNGITIENKSYLLITGSKDAKVRLTAKERNPKEDVEIFKIINSENITLSGFTIGVDGDSASGRGILITDSRAVTLTDLLLYNKAPNCWNSPVILSNSSNCKIKGCIFRVEHSAYGLCIMLGSKSNLIENNTLIESACNVHQNSIFMGNTTNNVLCNNNMHNIWVGGVHFDGSVGSSTNNTIYNNLISSISVQGDDNIIYGNRISSLGMPFDTFSGHNNTFYLNNIFGRGDTGVHGNQNWNSTVPVTYSYNRSEYLNYTGNFWYDYLGIDINSDGIGDVPYKVGTNNFDYYPLTEPYGLTFDLEVAAIARPYLIYASSNNTVLVSVGREGTYLTPESVDVAFAVDDAVVESKSVIISPGENIVRFDWLPPDVRHYKLSVTVKPEDTLLSEMSTTNNKFSIDVSVSPFLFDYSAEINAALGYSKTKLLTTGGIVGGFETSGWTALGIATDGEDPSTWKYGGKYSYSLTRYLYEEPKNSMLYGTEPGSNPPCLTKPEDFARMVLVLTAMGKDPTDSGGVNYLTMLKSFYDGKQFGEADTVEDDAFAILALVACGDKDPRTVQMITNATAYIENNQNEDGGWSYYGGGSDVKTTALVIQALTATDTNAEVKRGLEYLKKAQNEDGGYSNVKVTTYAIQAFIAAGEDISSYSKTVSYLRSLQQEDGSFNYTANFSFFPPKVTSIPIPALCGEPFPATLKTMRVGYELPDVSVSDIEPEDIICVNTSHTVTAYIKSNGGIFYADLFSDGVRVERQRLESVWYDSLTSVSFRWTPNTTGIHNLTVLADSMANITESDEGNNNATKQVTVVYPDLYPTELKLSDTVYVNLANTIKCTISGTTDESFNVTLEADEVPVGVQRVEGVRESTMIAFTWRPVENRTYKLAVIVNSDDRVRERNDKNNILVVPVNVILTDLIPTSITADAIFVNATNKVNITVEGIAECFNISLIENGTVVGKTTNVTCYGKENISINWKPTSLGSHTMTVFVDSDDNIKETNEGDNNITGAFNVLLPDLVPEDITPEVQYIAEVNTINVKVNGTAEGFNATLVVDEINDKRDTPCFVIRPIFNGSLSEAFPGTISDSNLTYNITAQRRNWSWADINLLNVSIVSNTTTGLIDSGYTWSVDYVAVVVNYTYNSTIQTLELNASNVIYSYNWSKGNNTYIPDGEYTVATDSGILCLGITDADTSSGNVTSVIIKVEQHIVNNAKSKKGTHQKKTNLNTYNHSIMFEWLPTVLGEYNLSVSLDPANNIEETNETNNNLTERVIVANRIDLELTSPLGVEIWAGIRNITWNATYEYPLLIDLYYSPDRGYRWVNITTNVTNNGTYAWNTRDAIDGEYMIRIIARSGQVIAEDQSDVFYLRNENAGEEWGSFHANAGYAPCDGPDTADVAWMSDDIGASTSSSLIVAGGKVFVYATGEHGNRAYASYTYLTALDASTGEVSWATEIAPGWFGTWATPAYKDRSIYVASGAGIYRIDADTGDINWEFRYPSGKGSVDGGPAVTSRAIYVGDWEGCHYYCIPNNHTKPREVIWEFNSEGRAQSTPAVAYGKVYFGSFCLYINCQSKAFCVDAGDGTEIWSTETGDICGTITVADGRVYFSTYTDPSGRHFYALDALNGTVLWAKEIVWSDSTPAYKPPSRSSRSYIYVATDRGEIYCFDAKTGDEIWSTGGVACWTTSPVVTKDGKVFAGHALRLYCLDAFTGEILWDAPGGPTPAVTNGFVYTVNKGRVIAYGNGTLPDLTVEAKAPGTYVVGETGVITAEIENIGKSNVTKSFKVELRHKGAVIGEQTVNSTLGINETIDVEFEWTPITEGVQRLSVEVDPPPGNVSESSTINNIANVTVVVESNEPDLTTKIITVSPNPVDVGKEVKMEANVSNIGYETNKSFWVWFSVDDIAVGRKNVSLEGNTRRVEFAWKAAGHGTHKLTVEANPADNWTIEKITEATWKNNIDSQEVVVLQPTPTPTPTPAPGFGPGGGGGGGGGSAGGFGAGSGTGESGSGEPGGMQMPVNVSTSAAEEETKNEVFGYPFGNTSSGASGGGGTIPLLLVLVAIFIITVFYFGYYREKKSHAKHISLNDEGEEKQHRRIKHKK